MDNTNFIFRLKRGQSISWANQNIILLAGEPGIELDTHRMKVGDGVTPWKDLPYTGITAEEARAIASEMSHLSRVIVNSLGDIDVTAAGAEKTIYMVLSSKPDDISIYDEYMVINGKLEAIGTTKTDLTGYATEDWVKDQNYLTTIPSNIATQEWVNKQNYLTGIPNNVATHEWIQNKNYITENHIFDSVVLKDKNTNICYYLCIEDGKLVTSGIDCLGIIISTLPNKTNYTDQDSFDPTGMIVHRINVDNSLTEITDYTYSTQITTPFIITYTDKLNVVHTASIDLTITKWTPEAVLQDFEWTDEGNGTYSLHDWKGTTNGVASTEVNIPNEDYIIL